MPPVLSPIASSSMARVKHSTPGTWFAPPERGVSAFDVPVRALRGGRPAPLESHFDTHDGQRLFYRHWAATGAQRRGAVVLFHRGHEHGGRMAHLADELGLPEFDIFAWDAHGHGRSPGPRGYSPGVATSVRDVQTFIDHIVRVHGVAEQDIHVVAQSVAAVVVATWAHDYAPRVRGITLASPAFKVKLYVPFARAGLALLHRLRGLFYVDSYVQPQWLTHDAGRIASYRADPLITKPIAVNMLLDLYRTAERVVDDAQAITVPTQLLISGADAVVHQAPQRRFFERLGSAVRRKLELPGFYHDTLGEKDRAPAVAAVRDFVRELFAQAPRPVDLSNADRAGVTHEEARALAQALAPWSPRGLYWAATRAALHVGGALSDGLRLGHATGFDSGSTLDYIYRDEARGRGALGRLIDRQYLDAIGWRGIRQRRLHVQELLRDAMARVREDGQPVRVLDVAAGHGRYVLDAVLGGATRVDAVLLRDYSPLNVQEGRALIAARGLAGTVRFEQGDAFVREQVAAALPWTTVGVVSGLYELFGDNALVSRSLAGLADAIPEGGYLVYTGQPWHPQLEMIARCLTSHREGQAWIMRRRSQAEMDQLVAAAGFRKVTQRIDPWGIFTVSLAQRVAR